MQARRCSIIVLAKLGERDPHDVGNRGASSMGRSRLVVGLAIGLAVSGLATAPAGAKEHAVRRVTSASEVVSGPFTFYSLGGPHRRATDATIGPDGNLWFIMSHPTSIGRMTASGNLSYFHESKNFGPMDLTTGPDGALWFLNTSASDVSNTGCSGRFSVGRITTRGKMTFFRVPGLFFPSWLMTGPDRGLWFENGGCGGVPLSLDRMSASGVVTATYQLTGYSDYSGILDTTFGPDGNLWFVVAGSSQGSTRVGQAIGRVDIATGAISTFPDTALAINNEIPTNITSGPDGALWFANSGGACEPYGDGEICVSVESIARITTSGQITSYNPPNGFNFGKATGPVAMTSGPDDSVWFSNYGFDPSIGRITTSGAITVYPMGGGHGGPESIVADGEGNLWFTASFYLNKKETYRIGRMVPS